MPSFLSTQGQAEGREEINIQGWPGARGTEVNPTKGLPTSSLQFWEGRQIHTHEDRNQ